MRNISTLVLTAAAFAATMAPILASAGPNHGGRHLRGPGPGGHGPALHGLMHRLDLSEEQQAQAEELISSHRNQMEALHQAQRDAKRAVAEQIHAEVFDEIAIRQATESAASVEADLAVARAQLFHELRKILNAEQLAELESLRESRRERREEWRERRGRHHRYGSDEDER